LSTTIQKRTGVTKTMSEETALKIPIKPPMGGLKKGILANKAEHDAHMASIDPKTVPNRLGLVIDDSGSMGSMDNAHKAVQGFTANCNMRDTNIAVYPLNKESKHLVCDYDLVNLYVSGLQATGGTPIYKILENLITEENITRAVLFSDGSPTDSSCLYEEKESGAFSWNSKSPELAKKVIKIYNEKEIPIDTIYIGMEGSSGYEEMKELARLTNGTFINFKDSHSLAGGLKYLSPKYRALLANPEIKERIQRGEQI
jgi:Mg-chelatase subunit ChlD